MAKDYSLEFEDKLQSLAFGYIQQNEKTLFIPIVVSAGKDEKIYFYYDSIPDEKEGMFYRAKMVVPAKELDCVYHVTYKNNVEFKDYGHISLIFEDRPDQMITFFYRSQDKKEINAFIRDLMGIGVPVKEAVKDKSHNDIK